MVGIFIHHGGAIDFVRTKYVHGEVTFVNNLDLDYLSITHILKLIKIELKYNNVRSLWWKFSEDRCNDSMSVLDCDADILRIIALLDQRNEDELHVYAEHGLDVPVFLPEASLPPTPLSLTSSCSRAPELCVDGGAGNGGAPSGAGNDRGAPTGADDPGNDGAEESESDAEADSKAERAVISEFSNTDIDVPEIYHPSPSIVIVGDEITRDSDGEANGENGDGENDGDASEVNVQNESGRAEGVETPDVQQPENISARRKKAIDWFGTRGKDGEHTIEEQPSDGEISVAIGSQSEGDSLDSDGGHKVKYADFHEDDLCRTIQMVRGLNFVSVALFKEALKLYAIQKKFDYRFLKNDKLRVRAKCKGAECPWMIQASWTNLTKDSFQVKTMVKEHNCGVRHKNPKLSHRFSVAHYVEQIRDNPNLPPTALGNL